MNGKFESILGSHFDKQEIQEIQTRADYEKIKIEIEQLQADNMLDNLETRINQEVKNKDRNLHERFDLFIKSLKTDSSERIIEVNEKEYIKNKENELREKFINTLSGNKIDGKVNEKTILGFGGIWALEQIENGEKIPKDSSVMTRFTTWIKAQVGYTVMAFLGYGEAYDAYKEDVNNISFPEVDNHNEDNLQNNIENHKYRTIINIFAKVFNPQKGSERPSYGEVFSNKNFMKLSIDNMNEMKRNNFNNSDFINFKNNSPLDIEDIKNTIRIITEGDGYKLIKEIYQKKGPSVDFKGKPLSKLFDDIHQDLDLLENIGITQNGIQIFSQIPNTENISESTKKYVEKKGFTIHLLSIALNGEESYEFKSKDKLIEIIKGTYDKDQDNETEVVNNIVEYGFEIQSSLFQNNNSPFEIYDTEPSWLNKVGLNIESNEKIKDIFTNKPLTLNEVMRLRVITGETTDFNKMNGIQQTVLYNEVRSMLMRRKKYDLAGIMMTGLFEASLGGISESGKKAANKVPDGVKNVISNTMKATRDKLTEGAGITIEMIWGAFKQSPGEGITAGLAFIPFFTDRYSAMNAIMGD